MADELDLLSHTNLAIDGAVPNEMPSSFDLTDLPQSQAGGNNSIALFSGLHDT